MDILTYLSHTFSLTNMKAWLTLMMSAVTYLIGDIDIVVEGLLVLMFMDFVLGFSNAWRTNTLSKQRLMLGMMKIVAYCIAIIVGNMVDYVIFHVHSEWGFENFIIVYLAITEALSTLKFLEMFGVKLPQRIIDSLTNYRDMLDEPKK